MGSIRSANIKRVAREIVEKYPDMISEDFQKNKELVQKITNIPTKRVRNILAGYVTRYYKVIKYSRKKKPEEDLEDFKEEYN
ncbi:MAG: 30S ribosomal protein S17e [Thermoplasmata archaeon]